MKIQTKIKTSSPPAPAFIEAFGHIKCIQKSYVLTHTINTELPIQRICYLLSPQAAAAAMVAILLLISSLAVDQLSAAMACS